MFGIEGDYGFSNAIGGKAVQRPLQQGLGFFFTCDGELNQLASVAGRLGVTWGRALFYGKAGWAGE